MKLAYINLGCPKNQVDLEIILGTLENITITENTALADVIIVNTCAFIDSAKQESIDTILELASGKKENLLLVTGCLSQRYKQKLYKELPEIDFISNSIDPRITAREIANYLNIRQNQSFKKFRIGPYHTAFLKISEGCSNRCSYCAIPLIKGPYQSYPFEEILQDAGNLVRAGTKELIIIAQDTTNYKQGRKRLADILLAMENISELKWIRLMYTHPLHWNERLIDVISGSNKIVPYIDLPIQHINNRILKSMNRQVTKQNIKQLVNNLRNNIPKLAIRTSLIVGYPDESDKEFEELYGFVRETAFERLGVFTYSSEENTCADNLEDNIPEQTKLNRQYQLMELQAEISYEHNLSLVGQTLTVIIDERDNKKNKSIGRTEWDAPEIDNTVMVSSLHEPGSFQKVRIDQADTYDLYGEAV